MTRLSSSRRALLLWALGLAALAGAALGLPPLFFALTDRADFSSLDIGSSSQAEAVYTPANTDQILQMIEEGRYSPLAREVNAEDAQAEALRCLEEFASRDSALGALFSDLFLDPYNVTSGPFLSGCQVLAGVSVFEGSVCTSTLTLSTLEAVYQIPGDGEGMALSLGFLYNPEDLTLYAFTLSGLEKNFLSPAWLQNALLQYLLIYLGADLEGISSAEGQEADQYRQNFLPDPENHDYWNHLGNSVIYWDGYTLSVNMN